MGRTGYTCIRHVFCSLNVLIWLCACGLIGAGLWMRLHYGYEYGTLVPQHNYASLDVLVLATGCVTFVVAFFGCCGAWFQSRCLLITYFSLVILLFLAEFLCGAFVFIFQDQIRDTIKIQLQHGIKDHYVDKDVYESGTFANVWDNIQSEFHCCGVDNYFDWYDITAWPQQERVPDSCCKIRSRYCGGGGNYSNADSLYGALNRQETWHDKGCLRAFYDWLTQRLHVLGIVCLVVATIQLFGLIASMILFCTVRHKRSTHTYKSYDTTAT